MNGLPAPSPAAFLAALQLADSFFPTGAYAHSHGLEGMVRRGWVQTAGDVEELLRHQFAYALLPADGLALLHAHRATAASDTATVIAIDRLLQAIRLPAELRAASSQMGRRLLAEVAPLTTHPALHAYRDAVTARESPGNSAVALGVAACAQGIPAELAALALCHSFAVSVLGAAMRLLALTHSQCQAVLFRLHPLISAQLEEINGRPWEAMTCWTPELDLAAMGHEHDDLRMFAS